MGESHHRLGHFEGTDLFRRPSATARIGNPPLLMHTFSWKHLQDPADSGRLEEFNVAVRMPPSDHHVDNSVVASDAVEEKRKARKICHEVPAVAPEKVGKVASVVVIAGPQSEMMVDAGIGGGGCQEKKAKFPRVTFVYGKNRDAENGRDRASSPEKSGGEVAASACARISNDDIRSLPISAPADLVFGDGKHTDPVIGEHYQVSAPASGKVCTGDQKTGPSSSPESSVDLSLPKSAPGCRVTFRCGEGVDAENGRADDVGASGCAGVSKDDDGRLPSISAPADVVVIGDSGQTDPAVGEHHQVSAPRSDKVCAEDDQETCPSSPPESSDDLTPSPPIEALEEHSPASADGARTQGHLTSPLEAYLQVPAPASGHAVGDGDQDSGSSSPNSSDGVVHAVVDNTGGSGVDLHMLGLRVAMEIMKDEAIRSEVERQFGADWQRRAATRRAVVAAAQPERFSLRLSDEEVMEDIDAVSVREEVEREAPRRNRKRRRGG